MEHIGSDKINAYIEGQLKGDESMATEGHLAICDDCLKVFSGLKELGSAVKLGFRRAEASNNCPEDWTLGALVKGELQAEDLEVTEKHIKICNFCLDRVAAYYKSSKTEGDSFKASDAWKERAVDTLQGGQGEVVEHEKEPSGFTKVYDFINKISRQLPPLPGYALAAAMAVLLIWGAMPESTRIIAISSTEKLAFKYSEAPSSFGFMGSERIEKFSGMEISKEGSNLEFSWKEISGAGEYNFSVIEKATGVEIVLDLKTSISMVSVPSERLKKEELYIWSIGGTTKSGQLFEYTGEFLITK